VTSTAHHVPGIVEIADEGDHAAVGRHDRIPGFAVEVDSVMAAPQFTVEDAPNAELAGDPILPRRNPLSVPHARRVV
jgi:hypothetical protein